MKKNTNARPASGNPDIKGTGAIIVKMLPLNKIRPNGWNPNVMSQKDEEQLINEVRHLGRLPKPIVVRKTGRGFQMVDGEHSWKAARECGLTEVPCEIIEADDLEATRQTFKRNLHGENDPVKLGHLFQRMKTQMVVSGRKLGELLEVAEGTIRNFILYADAAKLRNDYARDHSGSREKSADDEIASSSVKQVRTYLELPKDKRDEWFDAGARLENAEEFKPESEQTNKDADSTAKAAPASEASDHAEADVADDQGPEHGDVPRGHAQGPTFVTTAAQSPSFDQGILDALEDHWQRADEATRQKFLAGILAEPTMLAFARQIIKQGS